MPSAPDLNAAAAPAGPGVYIMKDAEGTVLYVGKARCLRRRLAAYFKPSGHADPRIEQLVRRIAAFETVVTRTEKEALILESSLIKRHRPRYNVTLKDDKRYPSLRLDLREAYPRFEIVRQAGGDEALYFGPFASANAVRETLRVLNRTFKLRQCRAVEFKTRRRPCLHCQMHGCFAPCCRDVPPELYREHVREAVLFLKGRTRELLQKIRAEMQAAAQAEEFEKAARLRDKLFALEKTVERQVAATTDFKDRDVFAAACAGGSAAVTALIVRGGVISGSRHYRFPETIASAEEILRVFLSQFYETRDSVPAEILVADAVADAGLIAEALSAAAGRQVRLLRPVRGEKARLTAIARANAQTELEQMLAERDSERDRLRRLKRALDLRRLPERIECVDNSTLMGRAPVAARVVFVGGRPHPDGYRKYRLQSVEIPDDYAAMAEVLGRRFRDAGGREALPDLLLIDGGKGQLNTAAAVMRELNLEGAFDLAAIAKRDERRGEARDKVFLPGRSNPVNFGRENDLLLFLQRVRDEAHRYAVGFHRRRRRAAFLRSALDGIPGVGRARKAALLKRFGTVEALRAAAAADIAAVPGFTPRLAEAVRSALSAD
jgi:excinuclease ABC subunit C